ENIAASRTAQLLHQDQVDFLLGSYSDRVIEVEAGVAERERVPYVAGSGGARPLFRRPHQYLFGGQTSIEQLSYTIMRWVDEQQKAGHLPTPGRVAVLADSTLHGREFREGVVEFVNKTPSRRTAYSLVFDEALEPGQADFAPVLGRLGSANAD